jgi:hypothetical protein
VTIKITNYQDVSQFGVDEDKRDRVFAAQTEAVLMWTTSEGWPVGVMHRYVWHDGRFWMTCAEQRKRVPALRKRPHSSVSVSSEGTSLGADINIVAKTLAVVHGDDDVATKAWFYPALALRLRAGDEEMQAKFVTRLDHPGRVVIELVPQAWITYDGNRLDAALRGQPYDPAATKPTHSS